MTTINDIAKLANVAKSTVSRFLNGGPVSAATRRKIEQVIAETQYQPNIFAQSLKAKQTGMIGVIIPRIGSQATNDMLLAIDQNVRNARQHMLIVTAEQSVERELEAIENLALQKVDGIIFIATAVTPAHRRLITKINVPVVIVGQACEANDVMCSVSFDDFRAGYLLADYAIRTGHQHLLYIGVDQRDIAVGRLRKEGVIARLNEVPDQSVRVHTWETSFFAEDAYRLAKEKLKDEPADFVIAATDNLASGVVKAMHELGIDIPEQKSIAGFGGYQIGDMIFPSLTTISYPYHEAGVRAVSLLNEKINGRSCDSEVLQGVSLVPKQSTRRML